MKIGEPPKAANTEIIQKITGSFGRYQLFIFLLVAISKFPVAYFQMAIIFLGPKVSYKCEDTKNETCPCEKPDYDRTLFSNTIVMEWNLICDRKWLISFTQTLFQFGTLLGSVFFGMAADKYGRKIPLLCAVVAQILLGFGCAFLKSYWLFTFFRFLLGATVGGTMVTTFVILMEFVGTKHRDLFSALYQVPFNLGHVTMPLIAYFFRDYSNFQIGISMITLLMLLYFFFIPETPRWLIAVKRTEEAIKILEKVAKVNKRPTDNIKADVEAFQAAVEHNKLRKGTIVDLFRTPNMRKNILIMSYDWLTCSYCFYGVSQYVGQLSGDIFMNVAASAIVTTFGTLLSIPLMKILGRRTIVIIFCFLCAFCLLVLTFIHSGIGKVVCATVGVVSSFIVFVLVYLYCSELFPTVLRNAAIGFSSMMARVGSMVAPFVVALEDRAKWLPPVIFALVPLIAGCMTFFLPETKDCELMTTIEEGENFGKKQKANTTVKIN